MKEGKKQFLFVKNKLSEMKTFDVIIEDHQKWVETRNRCYKKNNPLLNEVNES